MTAYKDIVDKAGLATFLEQTKLKFTKLNGGNVVSSSNTSPFISVSNNTSKIDFWGGATKEKGGALQLIGGDNVNCGDGYKNSWVLSSNGVELKGQGTKLTFGDVPLPKTVNNVVPDSSGNISLNIPSKTSDLTNDKGFLVANDIANKVDKSSLATVATSGSYNDLKNKPTIPDITVDTALSKTSSNAIANKAVKNSLYFYVGNTAPADPIENMIWLNPSELEQTVIDLSSCVKSVNGTQPDGNGNVSIEKVATADNATADGKGNVIADTYSTKSQAQSDMTTLQSSLEAKITALSNELATYKSTVSDLLLKLRKMTYPVSLETSELSKLTSAAVGSGSIYLSQSWRNFDGLLIEYTDDSGRYSMTCYLSTWEHERRIANALALGVNSYGLFYGGIYWFCNPSTSTNTTLTNVTENCKIQAIYGVKLKAVS